MITPVRIAATGKYRIGQAAANRLGTISFQIVGTGSWSIVPKIVQNHKDLDEDNLVAAAYTDKTAGDDTIDPSTPIGAAGFYTVHSETAILYLDVTVTNGSFTVYPDGYTG